MGREPYDNDRMLMRTGPACLHWVALSRSSWGHAMSNEPVTSRGVELVYLPLGDKPVVEDIYLISEQQAMDLCDVLPHYILEVHQGRMSMLTVLDQ